MRKIKKSDRQNHTILSVARGSGDIPYLIVFNLNTLWKVAGPVAVANGIAVLGSLLVKAITVDVVCYTLVIRPNSRVT